VRAANQSAEMVVRVPEARTASYLSNVGEVLHCSETTPCDGLPASHATLTPRSHEALTSSSNGATTPVAGVDGAGVDGAGVDGAGDAVEIARQRKVPRVPRVQRTDGADPERTMPSTRQRSPGATRAAASVGGKLRAVRPIRAKHPTSRRERTVGRRI